MTEEKEESPYQVYYSMYCCDECNDNKCLIKRFININKRNEDKDELLNQSDIRDVILDCAKLRDLIRNYYKD